MKKYKTGMYGGKFMPFHKGHLYCLEYAVSLCETVYLLLMCGGEQEEAILKSEPGEQANYITPEYRRTRIAQIAAQYPNVVFVPCDISMCRDGDGNEDWDMETPIVIEACGQFDAVFGSEPGYAEYFKKAYPWAVYELVDAARSEVPISGTMVREMSSVEAEKWMV